MDRTLKSLHKGAQGAMALARISQARKQSRTTFPPAIAAGKGRPFILLHATGKRRREHSGMSFTILTNNPLVEERLSERCAVELVDLSHLELLKLVRKRAHEGFKLLTHPLAGSVKPNVAPFPGCEDTNTLPL